MKKVILIPLLLLAACLSKPKPEIPSFNLLMPDSTTIFNTGSIPGGKTSVLIFFSPDCSHCQKETADLLKNMDSLKNINFYFLTIDPMDRLRAFNNVYKIYQYNNITLGIDYTISFPALFKDVAPPYSVVYDGNKILRAIFKGETTASQIIAIANKLN